MAMTKTVSLGETLRSARRAAGLSQERLAIRAGTSQAAISRIERGEEEATLERLGHIAGGLGLAASLVLEPLAEPDPSSLQLLEQLRKSPQTRIEELIKLARFAQEIAP